MRHTRREVIDRARREFAKLDGLVRRLRARDWDRPVPRPPTRDRWTVQDALAHIVYWKEHTARVIRGERRPPEVRGLGVDQINRLVHERWRRRRPSEVLAWHRRVHEQVIDTLRAIPDEWFGRRERGPRWPADLDGHSAAHRRRDIEAALSPEGSAPSRAPAKRVPARRAQHPKALAPRVRRRARPQPGRAIRKASR